MTDDTQPEALRIADEFRECLERDAIPSIIDAEKAVAELCRQHARIAELEAQLEAVGAGGVQALSAAPAGWESVIDESRSSLQDSEPSAFDNSGYRAFAETVLDAVEEGLSALAASPTPPAEQQATKETSGGFHVWRDISTAPKDGSRFVATGHNYGLYSEVRHTCVAQWFRGCWMEASDWNETSELKYLTHWMPLPSPPDDVAAPAEQQAAPKAAPESFLDGADVQDESGVLAHYSREAVLACITAALESVAAPKAAPGERFDAEGFRAWVRKNLPDDTIIGSSAWWADHLTTWAQRFVKAAPQQEAHHLTQALTDPENQPNQYGVEFGMSGQQMHFKIGNQLFRLAYEPDDQQEFEFMKRMLIHAFSTFTPDVKTAPQQEAQEPVAVPRFNCWSTNEGDSWFDHPADSQAIYDCLGNDAKVGDEYELTAGWTSVTARYRITEVVGDGEEYEVECISHPHENSAPQPAPAPLSDDTERLEWLLWKLPGDALRYVVGELSDTSSGAEFRAAIDAAIAAQGGKV